MRKYLLFDECFADRDEIGPLIASTWIVIRDSRSAGQLGPRSFKMLAPAVLSWMEQLNKIAGGRISPGNI